MPAQPFIEPDPRYLRRVIEHRSATFWDALGRGLGQVPRLALFVGLLVAGSAMASALLFRLHDKSAGQLSADMLAMALWCWGALVIVVELCVLAVRSSADLAWPGVAPTTLGLFGRALLGGAIFSFFGVMASGLTLLVLLGAASIMIYGWSLPAALRGVRTCRWGLRSLATGDDPVSPDVLATKRGKLGRRIVVGRFDQQQSTMSIHGQAEIARYESSPADVVMPLDFPPQTLCIVAEASVDDGGYRGNGVRLVSGGLPVWIVGAEDAKARLAGFRSRLRLARALDSLHLAAVAIGGGLFTVYMALAILATL